MDWINDKKSEMRLSGRTASVTLASAGTYVTYSSTYAKHSRGSATSEAFVYFYQFFQEASLFYGEAHRHNALRQILFSFPSPFPGLFSLSTLARTVMMLLPGQVAPRDWVVAVQLSRKQ
jgi:hypothetical protein